MSLWGSDSLVGAATPFLFLPSYTNSSPPRKLKSTTLSEALWPDARPYPYHVAFLAFSVSVCLWHVVAVVRGRRVVLLDGQAGAWSSKGREKGGKTHAACVPALPGGSAKDHWQGRRK